MIIVELMIFLPLLVLFPFWMLFIVCKNKKKISEEDEGFKVKYTYLVEDVSIQRTWNSKYYLPVMIFRRLLLMAIPMIFVEQPWF
jgi:hypothetical protein